MNLSSRPSLSTTPYAHWRASPKSMLDGLRPLLVVAPLPPGVGGRVHGRAHVDGRGRGATWYPRGDRELALFAHLLLALDCRHTPPLLAGCGWLRSWDALPHRRSCALRACSLWCAPAARASLPAAWPVEERLEHA